MNRTELLNGGKQNDLATNGTVTGKMAMIYFVDDCTLSALLDENGNDVLAEYLGTGVTTGKGGATIARPDGGYFSSITGTAGYINYAEA